MLKLKLHKNNDSEYSIYDPNNPHGYLEGRFSVNRTRSLLSVRVCRLQITLDRRTQRNKDEEWHKVMCLAVFAFIAFIALC